MRIHVYAYKPHRNTSSKLNFIEAKERHMKYREITKNAYIK